MTKKNKVEEQNLENIESSLSKAEQFVESNKKNIAIAIVAIILIIGGSMWYNESIIKPNEIKAQQATFQAQYYFEKDSYKLALDGDGNNFGFLKISDEYSGTKAGNLSNYYAGLCHLYLNNFDKAIEKLKDFSTDNKLFKSMALGVIGDAYSEKNDLKEALNYYKKSADIGNSFTAPKFLIKAGLVAEKLNNKKEAISLYNKIRTNFPKCIEARDIDKLISAIK